jgi:hypothetical protein
MAELSRMNMSLLFIAFALLVMVAGILYRRRLSALRDRDTTQLTDDMVRRIEERGWLESDWRVTENNRKARYYRLTSEGRQQLAHGEIAGAAEDQDVARGDGGQMRQSRLQVSSRSGRGRRPADASSR